MNELIHIDFKDDNAVVSARDLHRSLEVKTRFSQWVEQNFKMFKEGEDFTSVVGTTLVNNGAVRKLQDYAVTIRMAEHLAMMSKTNKGHEIREYFIQVEKDFNSPEKIMARALLMADKKIKLLENENETLLIELEEATKNADYLDLILQTKDSLTITQIAQDYGMSARKMNQLLKQERIQRIVNGQWVLYAKYIGKGYISSRTFDYVGKDGKPHSNMTTVWTQLGRRFLYERLKAIDILPIIEQED